MRALKYTSIQRFGVEFGVVVACSATFDERWSVDTLLAVLEIGEKAEPDVIVVKTGARRYDTAKLLHKLVRN